MLLGAGIAITPPGELAQLDLQLWGMRLYATTAQTAGFVLVGAWRAPSAGPKRCNVPDCEAEVYHRGLCDGHWASRRELADDG